jgi:DNA polymerase-3 subunit alpha
MQKILKQAKPGNIEDLIALNALYRPGPMANIPQFIESQNG